MHNETSRQSHIFHCLIVINKSLLKENEIKNFNLFICLFMLEIYFYLLNVVSIEAFKGRVM